MMSDGPVQPPVKSPDDEEARFERIASDVLDRAGGVLSLSEVADMLATTRAAIYDEVVSGRLLGLMRHDRLVLPRCQFIPASGGKMAVMCGIGEVVQMFDREQAGRLVCLQWLVHADGNLGEPAVAALERGRIADVHHAAAAYLGLDEGL